MTLHVSPNGPIIQASSINAEVLRQQFEILTGGASGVVGSGDLVVAANATPNKTVTIASGFAVVNGTESAAQGSYHVYNDASASLDILTAHPANATNPRIDLVIVAVQDAQYSGALNGPVLASITGTPAGSPVAPTVPVSPYFNAVTLAQVLIPALSTTITNGNITDLRRSCSSPAGYLAQAIMTTAQSGIGATATLIAALSVSFNVPAGRRIRVTANVPWIAVGSACPGAQIVLIEDNTTQVGCAAFNAYQAGASANATIVVTRQLAAGIHSYYVNVSFGVGSGHTIEAFSISPNLLLVEDIGAA